MKCGKMLDAGMGDAEYCPECEKRDHAFDRVYSVFEYGDIASSLYRFKYLGRQEYAEYYADCFVRHYGGLPRDVCVDALLPVPLHASRKRRRGYNQAEAFARALSVRTGVPVETGLVSRTKKTRPQKELDYYGRLNNLKNAFIMSRNDVKYRCVALVDDIFTTGSTVDQIALLLKKQGVADVVVFTVASAGKHAF